LRIKLIQWDRTKSGGLPMERVPHLRYCGQRNKGEGPEGKGAAESEKTRGQCKGKALSTIVGGRFPHARSSPISRRGAIERRLWEKDALGGRNALSSRASGL